MKVWTGLLVNDEPIRACSLKRLKMSLRLNDHKVYIEEGLGTALEGLHHIGPKRDWGIERAIHHIHVEPISTCGNHIINLLSDPREIGGKNRRGHNNGRVRMSHKEEIRKKARSRE